MKLGGRRAQAFVARPDTNQPIVLLFGPDIGLISERAHAIVTALVPDIHDPFAVSELTGAGLAADPARLSDEARAMTLGGGNRVVWLRGAGDSVAPSIKQILDDPPEQSWIVMEAGELNPRSPLRQVCEKHDRAVAIACYGDESRDLKDVIEQGLRGHGLQVDPDALAYLSAHLGADRLVTRGEIEKLALYMVGSADRISLEDATACVGDSAPAAMDRLSDAVALGDNRGVEEALPRVLDEGVSPIAILRTLATHYRQLHIAAASVANGTSPDQAIKSLRPPVIFKRVEAYRRQLGRWPLDRLSRALVLLVEAEIDCKSTGMPAEAACARALMRIANAAGR
jgi:DNA polymerase III subunit delta